MNATDEMTAQLESTEHQSASIAPGSGDEFDRFDEQLRATVKDFQRTSDQWKPVEDLQNHLSRIDHHLDYETSERKAIYYCLVAIEREMKRRGSRTPELGWSADAKQMIAGWIQQLGWRKPPAGHEKPAVRSSVQETPHAAPVAQAAPEAVTPIAAVRQTVEQNPAAVRESLEQLAARQDQMEREITKLQAVEMEILALIPSPPAQPGATPARKPVPIASPSSSHQP